MDEQLICTLCNKTWSRPKTRGRKPNFCPQCVVSSSSQEQLPKSDKDSCSNDSGSSKDKTLSVYQYLYPKPSNYKDLIESTKSGSVWKCPSCGDILKLLVPITDVPTHRCTPNTVTVKPYQRIS